MNNAKNIMLDLETMGKRTKPALTEIAAVAYDMEGNTYDEFYRAVSLQSSIDAGLTVDGSTVEFWMGVDADAKASWFEAQSQAVDLFDAMYDFDTFIRQISDNGETDIVLWGNGTMADNRWIFSAGEAVGVLLDEDDNETIKHWQHGDVRNFMSVCELMTGKNPKKETEFIGVPHNPIDDCKHQIRYMSAAYKLMKKRVD